MATIHIIRDGVVEELVATSTRVIPLDSWLSWLMDQPIAINQLRYMSRGLSTYGRYLLLAEPPTQRTIAYRLGTIASNWHLWIPALLWIYHPQRVHVFSINAPDITSGMTLHKCPLPNVHASGKVCWGSQQVPSLLEMSQAFWSTEFNNELGTPCHIDPYNSLDRWQSWSRLQEEDSDSITWAELPSLRTLSEELSMLAESI